MIRHLFSWLLVTIGDYLCQEEDDMHPPPVYHHLRGAMIIGRSASTLSATWCYDPSYPLAVTVAFADGTKWRFARDLLRDGLLTGAGTGDVVIAPVREGVDMLLRTQRGQALTRWSNDDLLDFLEASERLVPWGAEPFDADALIRQVMT